jgi:hypothetical protein
MTTNQDIYWQGPTGAIKKFRHIGNGYHAETQAVLDPDEIAFYSGREFRTFKEFSIAQGASYNIKVVSTSDTIVYEFGASIQAGEVKVELVTGGTEGGSFSTDIPIFPCNTMSVTPVVSTGITMTANGTHSGGTVVDLLYADVGLGLFVRQATATEAYPQGFAAGTFYVRISNTGNSTANGLFRARWEER